MYAHQSTAAQKEQLIPSKKCMIRIILCIMELPVGYKSSSEWAISIHIYIVTMYTIYIYII